MSIEDKIRTFIQQHLYFSEDHPLKDDDSFLAEGIIDSMGAFELATFVEAEFGIKVHMSEVVVKNFDSVGQLAGYVRRKVAALGEPSRADKPVAVTSAPVPLVISADPAAAVSPQPLLSNENH